MAKIGILFDTANFGSKQYGYVAYKIFFDAVDTRQIGGCLLTNGLTATTQSGEGQRYCIAIESPDSSIISSVKKALSKRDDKELAPIKSRFLEEGQIKSDDLRQSIFIAPTGDLLPWTQDVLDAWKESRYQKENSLQKG